MNHAHDREYNSFTPAIQDPAATLDNLREAVTTLEDAARIARRVLGTPPHGGFANARAALRARETLMSAFC